MENKEILRCYKYYDDRGRKLSIFGEYDQGQLKILIFTCSKKDKFNKVQAKLLHVMWLSKDENLIKAFDIKPQTFWIPCSPKSTKFTFNAFCKANFSKLHETVIKVKGKMVSCEPTAMKFGKMVGGQNDTFLKVKSLF